ncbi:MAG: hypothetical protein V1859_06345 [archaeon]
MQYYLDVELGDLVRLPNLYNNIIHLKRTGVIDGIQIKINQSTAPRLESIEDLLFEGDSAIKRPDNIPEYDELGFAVQHFREQDILPQILAEIGKEFGKNIVVHAHNFDPTGTHDEFGIEFNFCGYSNPFNVHRTTNTSQTHWDESEQKFVNTYKRHMPEHLHYSQASLTYAVAVMAELGLFGHKSESPTLVVHPGFMTRYELSESVERSVGVLSGEGKYGFMNLLNSRKITKPRSTNIMNIAIETMGENCTFKLQESLMDTGFVYGIGSTASHMEKLLGMLKPRNRNVQYKCLFDLVHISLFPMAPLDVLLGDARGRRHKAKYVGGDEKRGYCYDCIAKFTDFLRLDTVSRFVHVSGNPFQPPPGYSHEPGQVDFHDVDGLLKLAQKTPDNASMGMLLNPLRERFKNRMVVVLEPNFYDQGLLDTDPSKVMGVITNIKYQLDHCNTI